MPMLHRIIAACCAAAILATGAQEPTSAPDPKHALTDAALLVELRRGGLTLYFRHTATDFSQSDARLVPGDCTTQRNLDDRGRAQARAIGAAIQALALPVGQVIASPYCRTLETARLIAGRADANELVRGMAVPGRGPDYSGLAGLLATPPDAGTLRVIAGHGNPFRALAGAPHLEEGEAAVIRGLGSTWTVVARVKAGDWEKLLEISRAS